MMFSSKILIKSLLLSCLILSSCGAAMEWTTFRDVFDDRVTLKTDEYMIASIPLGGDDYDFLGISFTIEDGDKCFVTLTTYGNFRFTNSYTIRAGNSVYLKAKNDSLFTFTNLKDVSSADIFTTIGPYRHEYWYAETLYPMSYADLIKLENADFKAARVETDNLNIDLSITAKQNKNLKQLVAFVLNTKRSSAPGNPK